MKAILYLPLCFICMIVTCSADCGGCKKVCVLHDASCCTKGGVIQYKSIVNGMDGELPILDPLNIPKLFGEIESTPIILTNIHLTGLRDCELTQLKLNVTDETYRHCLHCPKLTLGLTYVPIDECACQDIRKKVTITAYDCDITNTGVYGILVKEEDLLPHFFIQSVVSNLERQGELTFDICDTCCDTCCHKCEECCGDEEQLTTCDHSADPLKGSSADQKKTIALIFSKIIIKAMTILFVGIDTYNRKYLMGEVLPGSTVDCSVN